MYSGEYDACDVSLSVYPQRATLKNMPGHGGHIFQACPVWIYCILRVTSQALFILGLSILNYLFISVHFFNGLVTNA